MGTRLPAKTRVEPLPRAVRAALLAKGKKRCPRCDRVKPVTAFSAKSYTKDGLDCYCRTCSALNRAEAKARAIASEDVTAEARFLAKIKRVRCGCWIFRGALNTEGQGMFTYRGRNLMAHVAACYIFGKEVPAGLTSFQTCRVPPCANPDHVIFAPVRELSLRYWRDNPFRRNAEKTACIYGHPFVPANTHHFLINGQRTRVCLTCYKGRHPATKKRHNRPQDAMEPRAAKLIKLLDGAVKGVPSEIREDARTLVLMDILERRVTKATLTDAVRAAARQAWKDMPDRWRTTSIDAPLRGGEGLTLSDVLADAAITADPLTAMEFEEDGAVD